MELADDWPVEIHVANINLRGGHNSWRKTISGVDREVAAFVGSGRERVWGNVCQSKAGF